MATTEQVLISNAFDKLLELVNEVDKIEEVGESTVFSEEFKHHLLNSRESICQHAKLRDVQLNWNK